MQCRLLADFVVLFYVQYLVLVFSVISSVQIQLSVRQKGPHSVMDRQYNARHDKSELGILSLSICYLPPGNLLESPDSPSHNSLTRNGHCLFKTVTSISECRVGYGFIASCFAGERPVCSTLN
jgi:hypothetical protein